MMKKERAGYLEGIVSIIINSLLFVLKFWAGTVSGSLALIADAWHTLSDSASSVIVIAGTKLSAREADKEHPFGHGRWEHIASLFIGVLLAIIAYDFLKESIIQFREKDSANFGLIAIIVTITSILLKEGLSQYAFYLARKTGNSSIRADGWHHRSDALSSVIVLVGIFLQKYFWWIDSVLGFVISLMLFYAVYEIIKSSINHILGEQPDEKLVTDIKEIVRTVSGKDLNPHHFHIHNYVNHKEMTFHINMEGDTSIKEGHDVVTEIEDEIRTRLDIESTVHIEPGGHSVA